MRPGKPWMELALALSTALSRTPATERSEVEGDREPAQDSPRSGAESHLSQRRPLREALGGGNAEAVKAQGRVSLALRAGRAEPTGRRSSPAGGPIHTRRTGRWAPPEATHPPPRPPPRPG